jgi:hypothetical protein
MEVPHHGEGSKFCLPFHGRVDDAPTSTAKLHAHRAPRDGHANGFLQRPYPPSAACITALLAPSTISARSCSSRQRRRSETRYTSGLAHDAALPNARSHHRTPLTTKPLSSCLCQHSPASGGMSKPRG